MTGRVDLGRVADLAGVSAATASRVLSGRGPASAASRERVLDAAATLGYTPHPVARMLARGGGTRMILAIRDARADIVRDPVVARIAATVAAVADGHGLGVALRPLPLRCGADLAAIADDRSVAAVVLAGHDLALLAALPAGLRGRIAVIGAGVPGVPSADVDSAAGVGGLVEHLLASGRRRIAMISGPRWLAATVAPRSAYERLVRHAGAPPRVVDGDFTTGRGRAAATRILLRWPDTDAIVAVGDAAAVGVLDALATRGVRVPDDVAVAGFDDAELAGAVRPALTTATHPVERIAEAAARAALGDPSRTGLFPSRPVLRQTA